MIFNVIYNINKYLITNSGNGFLKLSKLCFNNDLLKKAINYQDLKIGDLGVESRSYVRYADYSGKVQSSYEAAVKANKAVGLGEEEVQKFSNHVGIYIGKDCAGRDLWIHCAGGSINTVTITNCSDFVYFYRMPNMDTQ